MDSRMTSVGDLEGIATVFDDLMDAVEALKLYRRSPSLAECVHMAKPPLSSREEVEPPLSSREEVEPPLSSRVDEVEAEGTAGVAGTAPTKRNGWRTAARNPAWLQRQVRGPSRGWRAQGPGDASAHRVSRQLVRFRRG